MAMRASMRFFAMVASALAFLSVSPVAAVGSSGLIGKFLDGGEHTVAHAHRADHAGGQRMANLLQLQVQRISPKLDPTSDEKFFKTDYPDDLRPKGRDAFQYPHPIVQDSGEYDRDYVKDENSDGGEWKAQATYDQLRSKMAEIAAAEAQSQKNDQEAKDAYEAAQKAEAEAASKVQEAKKKAEEAHEKMKEAKEDAAKLGENVGNGTAAVEGTAVAEAVKSVEHDVKGLEDCKKQLADAQARLEELMGDRAKAKEEQIKKAHDAEQKTHDAEEEVDVLEKEETAEEAVATDAMKKAADLQAQTEKGEAAYEEAHKAYEAKAKTLKDMQGDLEQAEKNLRRFRQTSVDKGGGVYRSGTDHGAQAAPLLITALSVGLLAAWAPTQ